MEQLWRINSRFGINLICLKYKQCHLTYWYAKTKIINCKCLLENKRKLDPMKYLERLQRLYLKKQDPQIDQQTRGKKFLCVLFEKSFLDLNSKGFNLGQFDVKQGKIRLSGKYFINEFYVLCELGKDFRQDFHYK